jgi:biotin carboxyl carrier protein
VHALAAALAAQAERRAAAPVQPEVASGWRNVVSGSQHAEFTCDGQDITVRYLFTATGVDAQVEGSQEGACPVPGLRLRSASAGAVVADVDGVRREFAVHRVGDVFYVDSALGSTRLAERPRFPEPGSRSAPGSLLAPMPGTVARVAVSAGQAVRAGAPVVVLEAMKMEHTVPAPHDGIVTEIGVRPGQTVDTGIVLALVEKAKAEEAKAEEAKAEEAKAEEAGAEEAGAEAGGAREAAPGEAR